MDIFADLDKRKDKEEYINNFNKSIKFCRKLLLCIFSSIGLVLVITGIILAYIDTLFLIIFMPIGLFLILLGLIFFFSFKLLNGEKAYERYQKRIKDGKMPLNFYDMNHRIIALEREVERLKEEVESLRKR